ncbi:uncharacterized protein LOC102155525 [Canis lupus familiaris]|uniref:uncharacterized protein LOC102155525 n=1 Tax=Canis lupus familiaris TaxID=9615 RepID=UPI0003ADD833|nr:uncharacterized protein LOC102155525 [Canis lupus familiaris]XP_038383064.1 uncharacterized protein LOC102155525 [Canis lupus familiaris]XP_038511178.1 uncharacterized protein LOC102155525 [Canis lupus familiaris]|eukprot:XP_022277125.1 uncharacterized protein LOC102155525 [Canis lupus familiaris]
MNQENLPLSEVQPSGASDYTMANLMIFVEIALAAAKEKRARKQYTSLTLASLFHIQLLPASGTNGLQNTASPPPRSRTSSSACNAGHPIPAHADPARSSAALPRMTGSLPCEASSTCHPCCPAGRAMWAGTASGLLTCLPSMPSMGPGTRYTAHSVLRVVTSWLRCVQSATPPLELHLNLTVSQDFSCVLLRTSHHRFHSVGNYSSLLPSVLSSLFLLHHPAARIFQEHMPRPLWPQGLCPCCVLS